MLSKINKKPIRILVVRPDRVGDVVLATPVFHTLKQSFKDCYVGALVSPYTGPLLKENPYIDVLITDDPGTADRAGDSFKSKASEIASYKFDVALLLMPTRRLAFMLLRARIPYRVGVGHILYEVITLMRGVSRHKYIPLRHESDYMLDLVRKILPKGSDKESAIWKKPEVFITEKEKVEGRAFLARKGFDTSRSIVMIHPGSGHSSPNWNVDRYARLAEMIVRSGLPVLATGSGDEKEYEKAFGGSGAGTAFGELSLRELASVISLANVFISASTGPMHIAAAVGTPTVSMFCPLTACSPTLWGPVGNTSAVILPPDDFCRNKCPGDTHKCTFESAGEGIMPGTVFDSVMRLLHEPKAQYSKDESDDNSTSNRS